MDAMAAAHPLRAAIARRAASRRDKTTADEDASGTSRCEMGCETFSARQSEYATARADVGK